LYVVDDPTFRLRLALEDGEALDQVCNVDGWIDVPGDGSWTATFLTLAEVGRLMARWNETGEHAGGAYSSQPMVSSFASRVLNRYSRPPATSSPRGTMNCI
jgi:hypothetical protein